MKKILISALCFSVCFVLGVVGVSAAGTATPLDVSGFEQLSFIIGAMFMVFLPLALLLFFYEKILTLLGGAGGFLRGLVKM